MFSIHSFTNVAGLEEIPAAPRRRRPAFPVRITSPAAA